MSSGIGLPKVPAPLFEVRPFPALHGPLGGGERRSTFNPGGLGVSRLGRLGSRLHFPSSLVFELLSPFGGGMTSVEPLRFVALESMARLSVAGFGISLTLGTMYYILFRFVWGDEKAVAPRQTSSGSPC